MSQVTAVILCGGYSTRISPLLFIGIPKQFLCLTGSIPVGIIEVQSGDDLS
jgi:mannose-1-phosphate guanylyltransferase/mannose-6-phosphate isomerase